jgi:RNA polymerase primary sigma factor
LAEKWTAEKVERIQLLAADAISLNSPIFSEWGDEIDELQDTIEDDAPSPEELIIQQDRAALIDRYLKQYLTEREAKILRLRFGFEDDGICYTLNEIAEMFGLTRERIRQLEAKALRKLRNRFAKNHIKSEDI